MRFRTATNLLAACIAIIALAAAALAQAPSRPATNGRPVPPLPPNKPLTTRADSRDIRVVAPPTDTSESQQDRRESPAKSAKEEPAPERIIERVNVEEAPRKLVTENAAPQVTVEIVGPESATVGETITYEVLVRNLGSAAVQKVTVEQGLPENLHFISADPAPEETEHRLSWKLASLQPGAERRLIVTAKAKDGGDIQTSASVSFVVTASCATRVSKPRLMVTMTTPETALIGEEVPFKIQVTNAGAVKLGRVILRNKLPVGLTHPQGREIEADIGALMPGETRSIVLRATAARSGSLANEIEAVADLEGKDETLILAGGPKTPGLHATAKASVHVGEPGLSIRQAGPKECPHRGEAIFTIDVRNNGTAMTKNVRVVDHLPENMEFVAASDDGQYDPASRTIAWTLGALDFGTQRMLTVKARATGIGEGINSVDAHADNDLNAKAGWPVRVQATAALSLEILDLNNPAPIRKDVTYEIRVFNQGSCPCTNLQISATLPEGMTLRDAQAAAPYKLENNQIVFAPYAKLATRADLVYRIKVQCKNPGDARMHVQLTCDQLQKPVVKEEISRFFEP